MSGKEECLRDVRTFEDGKGGGGGGGDDYKVLSVPLSSIIFIAICNVLKVFANHYSNVIICLCNM